MTGEELAKRLFSFRTAQTSMCYVSQRFIFSKQTDRLCSQLLPQSCRGLWQFLTLHCISERLAMYLKQVLRLCVALCHHEASVHSISPALAVYHATEALGAVVFRTTAKVGVVKASPVATGAKEHTAIVASKTAMSTR